MKYVSLDLETTGITDRRPENILMISMVVEDTEKPEIPVDELPNFTAIVQHTDIVGEPTALAMNAWILVAIELSRAKMSVSDFVGRYQSLGIPPETLGKAVSAYEKYEMIESVYLMTQKAHEWLTLHFGEKDKISVAGKNAAGFDMTFLPQDLKDRFRHSVIDPGTMFWNPDHDRMLPHSNEVMKRAGVSYQGAHDALEDARMVISAIRNSPYYFLKRMIKFAKSVEPFHKEATEFLDNLPDYLKERKR